MITATETATSERRVAPRFQPSFGTVCRFTCSNGEVRPAIGLVWNISETGVSMLTSDPPKAGTEVAAELGGEDGGLGMPIVFRVVHVRPMETGDYFLGARFTRPLDVDEIRPFLGPAEVAAPKGLV
jgi:hypothetical protein